ncbi:MAG: flavodoxin family protein [Deltaproteobacteria bacterium]|jgi:multimeric flavodoxin WrbA|nr:flavodoxin family protein [Deltaproteobacteria bacterium]
MKCVILAGSPRKNGNTAALLRPFTERLTELGAECELIRLHEKKIGGCVACRACQKDWSVFGCAIDDDMGDIFASVLAARLIVLAAPIYSWFCPAPMKAALDRLVYGMNKYYGDAKGPSLWAGRHMALLLTCGYRPEHGVDLFVEAMQRYCKHSGLKYAGMSAERHMGYKIPFMDADKEQRSREFAERLSAMLE